VPITGTDTRFMCGETGEVCNESHMKGVGELWGLYTNCFSVKRGGKYSYQRVLKS
jgi:hypothetical protein